jgi:3-deoxy-manno-octulosonate cytidylyltransferase (CMP-KDO synthetase)
MKIIAVIPARYQSSRFEGKPLADIGGQLMIERVYLQAKKVSELTDVYVATDDDRILSACRERNIKCMMTSTKHKTGTDRTGEVADKIPADLYVNIQGDEPLIEPETIQKAILPFEENTYHDIQVTNLMTQIKDPVELLNFTIPKVITAQDGRGVFLTRSAAPFPKGNIMVKYYKQVCVYGFTPEALRFFCTSPRGQVESIEDIEILRFIEAGRRVQYIEVDSNTVAVDTPGDLEKVRKILAQQFPPPPPICVIISYLYNLCSFTKRRAA